MRALFLQEIKTFFRSPSSIFIFVIPLILLVGLGYFIPAAYIIPSTISVGIVGAVLLYFGGGLEEIKRTSFLKVMGTTKLNKITTLVVKMSFAAIISMFTVVWVLGLGYFFTEVVDFLASDFGNLDDSLKIIPGKVKWNDVNWVVLFYAAALSLCVTLALAFCFAAIAKSSLSFYLLTFGYIAALILFGGVIMPGFLLVGNEWFHWCYYLIPNYYSGNQLTAAFNSGLSKFVYDIIGALDDLLTTIGFNNATVVGAFTFLQNFLISYKDLLYNIVELFEGDLFAQMAAAIDSGDWSEVDGGKHREYNDNFWDSLPSIGAWALVVFHNFTTDGLSAVWYNFVTKTFEGMGEYKIDEIFYLFYSIPSDSVVGELINNGSFEISRSLATIINVFLRGSTDFDFRVQAGTYYLWAGLDGHTANDGLWVDGVLGITLEQLTSIIINSGALISEYANKYAALINEYGPIAISAIIAVPISTIEALVGSMEYSVAFDFSSTKSIIDVFMPYAWIGFLAGISAWKFEWVN